MLNVTLPVGYAYTTCYTLIFHQRQLSVTNRTSMTSLIGLLTTHFLISFIQADLCLKPVLSPSWTRDIRDQTVRSILWLMACWSTDQSNWQGSRSGCCGNHHSVTSLSSQSGDESDQVTMETQRCFCEDRYELINDWLCQRHSAVRMSVRLTYTHTHTHLTQNKQPQFSLLKHLYSCTNLRSTIPHLKIFCFSSQLHSSLIRTIWFLSFG